MELLINEDLLKLIRDNNLNEKEALHFSFAVQFQEYGLLDHILETGLITDQNEPLYRINLTRYNPMTGLVDLIFPLFKEEKAKELFDTFLNKLMTEYKIGPFGHPANIKTGFSILSSDKETKENFFSLVNKLGNDFYMDRFCKVTANYYEKVSYCKTLKNYLAVDAYTYYIGYTEKDIQSDMI